MCRQRHQSPWKENQSHTWSKNYQVILVIGVFNTLIEIHLSFLTQLMKNGESTCGDDVRRCSGSPGESIVKELASNNDQFVEEFIDVFTKMIEKVSLFKLY